MALYTEIFYPIFTHTFVQTSFVPTAYTSSFIRLSTLSVWNFQNMTIPDRILQSDYSSVEAPLRIFDLAYTNAIILFKNSTIAQHLE